MNKLPLSYLTFISRKINTIISSGQIEFCTFDEVYNAINNRDLYELLAKSNSDFSIFSSIDDNLLYEKLSKQVKYFADAGNEGKELGIYNNKHGLLLLQGMILEMIQEDYEAKK